VRVGHRIVHSKRRGTRHGMAYRAYSMDRPVLRKRQERKSPSRFSDVTEGGRRLMRRARFLFAWNGLLRVIETLALVFSGCTSESTLRSPLTTPDAFARFEHSPGLRQLTLRAIINAHVGVRSSDWRLPGRGSSRLTSRQCRRSFLALLSWRPLHDEGSFIEWIERSPCSRYSLRTPTCARRTLF
jgi:hypothetical protein